MYIFHSNKMWQNILSLWYQMTSSSGKTMYYSEKFWEWVKEKNWNQANSTNSCMFWYIFVLLQQNTWDWTFNKEWRFVLVHNLGEESRWAHLVTILHCISIWLMKSHSGACKKAASSTGKEITGHRAAGDQGEAAHALSFRLRIWFPVNNVGDWEGSYCSVTSH